MVAEADAQGCEPDTFKREIMNIYWDVVLLWLSRPFKEARGAAGLVTDGQTDGH